MRSTLVLSLVILLPLTGSLYAQERTAEPLHVSAPPSVAKSASKARLLSVAHTAVSTSVGLALMSEGVESQWKADIGYWLFAYGALAAPSAGNFYARDYTRTQTGLAIRSAGAALVLTSVWGQILSPTFDIDNPDGGKLRWDNLSVAGIGIMATGAAYSIATAPLSVEEYNRKSAGRATPRVSLSPSYTPASGDVGVQVRAWF